MIVKITRTPQNGSSFKRLSQYITAKVGVNGDRVVFAEHNTGAKSIEDAVRLIEHAQKMNKETRADRTMHLVVSFPAGEMPSKEVLSDIERSLCSSIGMEDHQRLAVVHDNTSHLHMHIAINKIHPETKRCVSPSFSKRNLYSAARKLEKKHNLALLQEKTRDKTISIGAKDFEMFTGEQSFQTWMVENLKDPLLEIIAGDTADWQAVHGLLQEHGVTLGRKGRGFVFVSGSFAMKASTVDRSLSRAALEKVLGPFAVPKVTTKKTDSKKTYTRRPRVFSPEANELYQRFIEGNTSTKEYKAEQLKKLSQQRKQEIQRIKDFYITHRQKIWHDPLLGKRVKWNLARQSSQRRKDDLAETTEKYRRARESVTRANRVFSWNDFLSLEASKGDEVALKILRSRRAKDEHKAGNSFSGNKKEDRLFNMQRSVQRNGDVCYTVVDRFIDNGHSVIAQGYDITTIREALLVAKKQYGLSLRVDGDEQFLNIVGHIASKERSLGVRLSFGGREKSGIEL
jgi:hypothetical protein